MSAVPEAAGTSEGADAPGGGATAERRVILITLAVDEPATEPVMALARALGAAGHTVALWLRNATCASGAAADREALENAVLDWQLEVERAGGIAVAWIGVSGAALAERLAESCGRLDAAMLSAAVDLDAPDAPRDAPDEAFLIAWKARRPKPPALCAIERGLPATADEAKMMADRLLQCLAHP